MDSTGSISTLGPRMMPFLAILRHELRTLRGNWLVWLWLAATVVVTLLMAGEQWNALPRAYRIAAMLGPYLVFPWFFVVIVLGVSPVSGARVDEMADGVMSRPVTRHEYLFAAWAARVLVVLAVYLAVMIPAILMATFSEREPLSRNVVAVFGEDTLTVYGIVASLVVVSLVLTLQVSLAFLLGTMLRKPLVAIVVLVFVWYPINGILDSFSLESFSPISLSRALPTLLRESWQDPQPASQAVAEDGPTDEEAERLAEDAEKFVSMLSGVLGSDDNVPSRRRQDEERNLEFFQRDFNDFSLSWVLLGYGVPTLAAVALAGLLFCRRDL